MFRRALWAVGAVAGEAAVAAVAAEEEPVGEGAAHL